jgi:hypothetical protein
LHLPQSRAAALRLFEDGDFHHKITYLLLEPLDLAIIHLSFIQRAAA